jgi:tetratricopeptide (TPR) repeat protein
MNRKYFLPAFVLMTLLIACRQQGSNSSLLSTQQKDSIALSDSARKLYTGLAYYYNNNIHDTLVMKVPEVLDFCRDNHLWYDYYDTWMLLGEEYNFSGESKKAVEVAQEIHDDAIQRGNKYGLTAAEFIKALVYDNQLNREEATRSFERALASYPDDAEPFLKNSIYVYYVNELKNMNDTLKMHKTQYT